MRALNNIEIVSVDIEGIFFYSFFSVTMSCTYKEIVFTMHKLHMLSVPVLYDLYIIILKLYTYFINRVANTADVHKKM